MYAMDGYLPACFGTVLCDVCNAIIGNYLLTDYVLLDYYNRYPVYGGRLWWWHSRHHSTRDVTCLRQAHGTAQSDRRTVRIHR